MGGSVYYIDVGFPHLKLALEIDGRLHETDEDLFESDRWRQNALVADGWMVLRFTWPMLRDHPEAVVAAVRQAITAISDARLPEGGLRVANRRGSENEGITRGAR